jgi:hypothetical protein
MKWWVVLKLVGADGTADLSRSPAGALGATRLSAAASNQLRAVGDSQGCWPLTM